MSLKIFTTYVYNNQKAPIFVSPSKKVKSSSLDLAWALLKMSSPGCAGLRLGPILSHGTRQARNCPILLSEFYLSKQLTMTTQ